MAEHKDPEVTQGKGRKDEVGHTGIYPATGPFPEGELDVLTPGEINRDHSRHSRVETSDELKNAERLPRMGNEEDKVTGD